MYTEIEERMNKILKKQVEKEIILDGKKYKSIVSEETIKKLYNQLYEMLASEFNPDIIKEKLKIEKNYSERETVAINLYKNSNKCYKFIPIEEDNKKVMYYQVSFLEAHEKNEMIMLKQNKDMFFKIDELIKTFRNNEFGALKEGRYLELKEDSFINTMYIRARNAYQTSIISNEGWRDNGIFEDNYSVNSLLATRKYLDEIINLEIEDKNFLGEVYALKSEAEYTLNKSNSMKYLKKAIELSPRNQNVLVTALKMMVYEFDNNKKANLIMILDYLVKEIDYLEVDRESIYYEYEPIVLDEKVLICSQNKKFRETQLHKVITIYEKIYEKMKSIGSEKYEYLELKRIEEIISTIKN